MFADGSKKPGIFAYAEASPFASGASPFAGFPLCVSFPLCRDVVPLTCLVASCRISTGSVLGRHDLSTYLGQVIRHHSLHLLQGPQHVVAAAVVVPPHRLSVAVVQWPHLSQPQLARHKRRRSDLVQCPRLLLGAQRSHRPRHLVRVVQARRHLQALEAMLLRPSAEIPEVHLHHHRRLVGRGALLPHSAVQRTWAPLPQPQHKEAHRPSRQARAKLPVPLRLVPAQQCPSGHRPLPRHLQAPAPRLWRAHRLLEVRLLEQSDLSEVKEQARRLLSLRSPAAQACLSLPGHALVHHLLRRAPLLQLRRLRGLKAPPHPLHLRRRAVPAHPHPPLAVCQRVLWHLPMRRPAPLRLRRPQCQCLLQRPAQSASRELVAACSCKVHAMFPQKHSIGAHVRRDRLVLHRRTQRTLEVQYGFCRCICPDRTLWREQAPRCTGSSLRTVHSCRGRERLAVTSTANTCCEVLASPENDFAS